MQSKRYIQIRRETERRYGRELQPDDYPHPSTKEWREKGYGALWRNRVGMPRLAASDAAFEVSAVLDSINLATFRTDPDVAVLLVEARDAAKAFAVAVSQSNWALMQVPPKKRGA